MCGENKAIAAERAIAGGSSPRVRGKQLEARFDQHRRRLIPACAGKTLADASPPPPSRAHPRVCGENERLCYPYLSVVGSSPRVRGKPVKTYLGDLINGLIPACAGKTASMSAAWARPRAHPRVCGENRRCSARLRALRGSSPRVRGKLGLDCSGLVVRGLIPACAGKT